MSIFRTVAFLVSAVFSLGMGFGIGATKAEALLAVTGYWAIFAAFSFFVYALVRWAIKEKHQLIAFSTPRFVSICVCLVLAAFLYSRDQARYKILMDEPTLAGTAIGMHTHRQPILIEPSHDINGELRSIDKRPLFFPFLVSLLHDFLGFHPRNPFILNFLVTASLLFLLFTLTTRLTASKWCGYLTLALFASHPLIAHNASGGGFELLNLLMILLVAYAGYLFQKRPDKEVLNLLLSATVLLAQTRYESALFIISVGWLVLFTFYRSKKIIVSNTAIAVPLLLLPVPWQHLYKQTKETFWQLPEGANSAFGTEYLSTNLRSALEFFAYPRADEPGSPFLFGICVVSVLSLLFYVFKRSSAGLFDRKLTLSILALASIVVANFGLLLLYHWGRIADIEASRLALPLILMLCLAFGAATRLLSTYYRDLTWLAYATLTLCWVLSLPTINESRYTEDNELANRLEWVGSKIELNDHENTLLITTSTPYWRSYRINSINFGRALGGAGRLSFHQWVGTYDRIYVTQTGRQIIEEGIKKEILDESCQLGPAFKLESVAKTSHFPLCYTEVSRVTSIDMGEIEDAGGMKAYREKYYRAPQLPPLLSREQYDDWRHSLP